MTGDVTDRRQSRRGGRGRSWIRAAVRSLAAASLIAFCGGSVPAQEDPHAACAAPPGYVPASLLERAAPLRDGVGNSRESVTTASKQAQAFYDQGLNYLESYVWIEAARSFHQALRLDPGLAMANVGLSRVHSGLDDPEGARRFFEKAQALAMGAGDRERRRIEIRGKQLEAMEDLADSGRFLAYKKSLDDALAADLEDPQLWLLRGNAEEANASGRGQRGGAGSVAFYERVLKLVPDHASAHHYLVHSYETLGRIDQALEHGEAFARLAPAIPHAAHMWGHDLRRVGRVDEAIVQFLKADTLERAYYKAEKIDPALDWHHGHNLGLLASCYVHQGKMRLAEKTMREAAALGAVDAYRAFGARELPGFLIQRARYREALKAARAMTRSPYAPARTAGHSLAGQALIGLGRVGEAERELEAAEDELEMVPRVTSGIQPRRSTVEPWVEVLRGEILLRVGRKEEGDALLKEVARAMRAVPGPDAWTQTLFQLETLARSARESGDWELARHTALEMLDHDPAYGGSHFALALVLRHEKDEGGARREFEQARLAWRDADPDLPELALIRAGSPREASAARTGR